MNDIDLEIQIIDIKLFRTVTAVRYVIFDHSYITLGSKFGQRGTSGSSSARH